MLQGQRLASRLLRTTGQRARLAALLLLASVAGASAQTPIPTNIMVTASDAAQARRVELGIGKSIIVDLPRDAKEVFVANPKVANAIAVSYTHLTLPTN